MNKPIITGDTITVPANQEYLADVDLFVEGILRGYGAQESTIADIAISVSEVVNNAMVHGNKLNAESSVTVTIGRSGRDVTISVKDQGHGFNPETIANPIDEANLLREVGRGIFIVRALMDKVEITPSDNGTTIAITKAI